MPTEAIHEDRRARINKLQWHCRRALLELDLVFKRFWERHGDSLDNVQENALRELLAMEDHELWALISGKVSSISGDLARESLLLELRRIH